MTTRKPRSAALAEFALILSLLLLVVFITIEFGRAMYRYNTLVNSARDAARYLSVQLPNTHIAEARNVIVYGNPQGTGSPLTLGLSTSHVPTPTWSQSPPGVVPAITTVTVKLQGYSFNSLFPRAMGQTFGFSTISATMRSHTYDF